jgi:hypothetical protein
MTSGPGTAISVVVASFSGEDALVRCLESVLVQGGPVAEVTVATELDAEVVARMASRYPAVTFLRAPRGTGVFRLRSLGIEKTAGPFVALLEDHCTVAHGWVDALVAAHDAGQTVIGGPVENGLGRTAWDWAVYFCEYGALLPPLTIRPSNVLLAVNAAYDRRTLEACRSVWREAFYDSEVHNALAATGQRLYPVTGAQVESHLEMSLRAAARHLFRGGRRYGSYRKARSGRLRRLLLAVAWPAIPLVLLLRLAGTVAARRPRRLPTLLMSLPGVLCLLVLWSAGEAAGYLTSTSTTALRTQPQGG